MCLLWKNGCTRLLVHEFHKHFVFDVSGTITFTCCITLCFSVVKFPEFKPIMVDKIPWDTCVIALIICVFKKEFKKALLPFSKFVSALLPHPIQC